VQTFADPVAVATAPASLRSVERAVAEDQDLGTTQGREHPTALARADHAVPVMVNAGAVAGGDEHQFMLGQPLVQGGDERAIPGIADAEIAGQQYLAHRVTSA
jgi:hypothetical protein